MLCFFDLPLHVREEIYRYGLVMARIFVRPFIPMEYLMDPDREENYGIPTLPLLCVSRQVYEEAMPIYLSENTFSIVQVDLLAAARTEYPRVFENLKMIRSIELVFDNRDYIYMAQFLASELPGITATVRDLADGPAAHKQTVIQDLSEMHANFKAPGLRRSYSNSSIANSPVEGFQTHQQHIDNMKEYLWGRTLTFVRQTFQLSHLYIDLRRCICIEGCCRLATEVLDWGWFYVWIHGMPGEVEVRGTSEREKEIIARTLDRQHFHRGLSPEEVFDQDRVGYIPGFKEYNAVLRSVHQTLTQ